MSSRGDYYTMYLLDLNTTVFGSGIWYVLCSFLAAMLGVFLAPVIANILQRDTQNRNQNRALILTEQYVERLQREHAETKAELALVYEKVVALENKLREMTDDASI